MVARASAHRSKSAIADEFCAAKGRRTGNIKYCRNVYQRRAERWVGAHMHIQGAGLQNCPEVAASAAVQMRHLGHCA